MEQEETLQDEEQQPQKPTVEEVLSTDLEEIDLSGYTIHELPDFENQRLLNLNVSFSKLRLFPFPSRIARCLPNLQVLNLSGNEIDTIPKQISGLVKLR